MSSILFEFKGNFVKKTLLLLSVLPAFAQAAHPLITDDTGVQGQGKWQLELNGDRSIERDTRLATVVGNAKLTYGVTDQIDIGFQQSWTDYESRTNDPYAIKSHTSGASDAQLALKWHAFDAGKFSFSVNPYVNLPVGDDQRGLGNGRTGYGLNLAGVWSEDKVDFLLNAGYTRNNNSAGDRKNLWNASAGAIFKVHEKLKLVAETGLNANTDRESQRLPAYVGTGLIFSPAENVDLDLGYHYGIKHNDMKYSVGAGVTVRW